MYLVFTRMPVESYRRRLRSLLLYVYYVFWALINSLVCWFFAVIVDLIKKTSHRRSDNTIVHLDACSNAFWECIVESVHACVRVCFCLSYTLSPHNIYTAYYFQKSYIVNIIYLLQLLLSEWVVSHQDGVWGPGWNCCCWSVCFTSTETVGLLGTRSQDGQLDFHTASELARGGTPGVETTEHYRVWKWLLVARKQWADRRAMNHFARSNHRCGREKTLRYFEEETSIQVVTTKCCVHRLNDYGLEKVTVGT